MIRCCTNLQLLTTLLATTIPSYLFSRILLTLCATSPQRFSSGTFGRQTPKGKPADPGLR